MMMMLCVDHSQPSVAFELLNWKLSGSTEMWLCYSNAHTPNALMNHQLPPPPPTGDRSLFQFRRGRSPPSPPHAPSTHPMDMTWTCPFVVFRWPNDMPRHTHQLRRLVERRARRRCQAGEWAGANDASKRCGFQSPIIVYRTFCAFRPRLVLAAGYDS
jgi:hypothetical protein